MAVTDEPVIPSSIGERVAEEVRDLSARFTPAPAALSLGAEELRLLFEGVEDSVKRGLGEASSERNYAPAFAIGAAFGAGLSLTLFVSAFLLTRL